MYTRGFRDKPIGSPVDYQCVFKGVCVFFLPNFLIKSDNVSRDTRTTPIGNCESDRQVFRRNSEVKDNCQSVFTQECRNIPERHRNTYVHRKMSGLYVTSKSFEWIHRVRSQRGKFEKPIR